jgi:gluconokinase
LNPPILVLGGVSGSGKSVVGRRLAELLGGEFHDGDDFHPPANKEKMSRREPLTDADRIPWLNSLADLLRRRLEANTATVVACSALKPEYRKILVVDPRVKILLLKVDREELIRRLAARKNHFFPASLLDSQLSTLVPPQADEPTVSFVDANRTPDEVVEAIRESLSQNE